MALTQAQIEALEVAVYTGLKRLRVGDQEFEWHTPEQGQKLIAQARREVNAPAAYRVAATSKGV